MKITLIKKYKFHSRELPVGTEIEVTNELGEKLIERKIALKGSKVLDKKIIEVKTKDVKKNAKFVTTNEVEKPHTKID